jgi:hypothetical protein
VTKLLAAILLVSLPSCLENNATFWKQYNGSDDSVVITVQPTVGEDALLELLSTTGAAVVGEARVSPGAGPVGTEHFISVTIDDQLQADVGRISIEANSVRGLTVHEMIQDSAQKGYWEMSVTSLGEDDESRQDDFTFVLWEESTKDDPDAVKVD